MIKLLKNIGVWLLMFTTVFVIMYVMVRAFDAEYEIQQERERIYFEKVEEMRK